MCILQSQLTGLLSFWAEERGKWFTEDLYLGLCVYISAIFNPPFSTHPYILGYNFMQKDYN